MSESEDWPEDVRYPDDVSREDVLGVFEVVEGPAVTTSDVKMVLGCSQERARELLEDLRATGDVRRRKSAGMYLYWRTSDEEVELPPYYQE